MFDWYRKLWGEGKLKFAFKTADGRNGTAKCRYIGDVDTLEFEDRWQMKREIEFELGVQIVDFQLVDILRK